MALVYDAVIFDLDGTLTRSEEGIINSVVYALEQLGFQVPDKETLLQFIGPPLAYSFTQFCGLTQAESLQAQDKYRERYVPIGYLENEVYTGIRSLIKKLKKAGAYLGIATGKPQKPTEAILKHFKLDSYFDEVIGTGEKALSSDKKELITLALAPFDGGKAVMVGDRKFDIQGAKAVGIDSIGVGYGYGTEDELKQAGCTHFVNTVAELEELLLDSASCEKGIFLTVEGLDGSGKTTQVDALETNLRRFGFDVRRTREPGGCPISESIRTVILDKGNAEMSDMTEVLLYAASRAQHVHEVIKPALAKGKVVLCDRFVDSSIVYQGGGREIGVETVANINAYATDGLSPDITVYLNIGHETALERRKNASDPDRIERESAAFHKRVEVAYQNLIAANSERYVVVDARGDKEQIAADCFSKVLERLL